MGGKAQSSALCVGMVGGVDGESGVGDAVDLGLDASTRLNDGKIARRVLLSHEHETVDLSKAYIGGEEGGGDDICIKTGRIIPES